MEAGLAQRARIVLLAAEGLPNTEIARRVGMTRPTVIQWRGRYVSGGIAALGDLDRSGRPPVIDDAAVVIATLKHRRNLGRDALVGPAARPSSWASRSPRSRGSGATGASSRGDERHSSSPPIRSWTPRSATSSDSI